MGHTVFEKDIYFKIFILAWSCFIAWRNKKAIQAEKSILLRKF